MVKGDVIFCATGVTSGDLANGVKDLGNEFEVNTNLRKSLKNAGVNIKDFSNEIIRAIKNRSNPFPPALKPSISGKLIKYAI